MQAPNNNDLIVAALLQLAKLNENDKGRQLTYSKAAKIIKAYPQPIVSGAQAMQIKGIGGSIANKIDEILATGKLAEIENIPNAEKEKQQVIELFKGIYGVGKVTANKWYNEEGMRTLEDLKKIYNKMTHGQKLGYYFYSNLQLRIPRPEVEAINAYLHSVYDPLNIVFMICGSFRRGLPDSGDVDILVINPTKDETGVFMQQVIEPLQKSGFLIYDLAVGKKTKYMGICQFRPELPVRRFDIRLINPESWAYGVLYFTGSDDFNISLRNRAISMALKLSEYDLFDANGKQYPATCERDIFNYLNVEYLEPKDRIQGVKLKFTDMALEKLVPVTLTGKWYRPYPTLLIYVTDGLQLTGKIAGFDVDHTIIAPNEHRQFPKDANDIIMLPNRLERLKTFIIQGFTLCMFTNQKSDTETKFNINYNRICNVVKLLNLPCILMMSIADDQFRKPNPGMWFQLRTMINIIPDTWFGCFYCGDAAGRKGQNGKKADFSDSDLQFANSQKLPFYVPEQLF